MRLAICLGVILTVGACEKTSSSEPAAAAAADKRKPLDPATRAKLEFEVVSQDLAAGTSKLYSRGDFLPYGDERAMSEGDFIGRLRALFGSVQGDEWVLRHRRTGLIITAYSAQSGPSYGGASKASLEQEAAARKARIAADPELAAGSPVDWSKTRPDELPPEVVKELMIKEHAWRKRHADAYAGELAPVIARLDELVESAEPVDWEATRYYGEEPTVYRIGARGGKAFDQEMPIADGLALLLADAERGKTDVIDSSGGVRTLDDRAIDYWIAKQQIIRTEKPDEQARAALAAALPRVQAAWFRNVAGMRAVEREYRLLYIDSARDQIMPLQIDRTKALAALRAVR